MESIMQFIYLGEATFYEERMDEFLTVAKSLEIKQLYIAERGTNDEPSSTAPETQTVVSDKPPEQSQQQRSESVSANQTYECDPCQMTFVSRSGLYQHKQSVHQGVKYACDQCDLQTVHRTVLDRHIKSKHDSLKYACNQCEYQATRKDHLTIHVQSRHEGIKYACDQCENTWLHSNLV